MPFVEMPRFPSRTVDEIAVSLKTHRKGRTLYVQIPNDITKALSGSALKVLWGTDGDFGQIRLAVAAKADKNAYLPRKDAESACTYRIGRIHPLYVRDFEKAPASSVTVSRDEIQLALPSYSSSGSSAPTERRRASPSKPAPARQTEATAKTEPAPPPTPTPKPAPPPRPDPAPPPKPEAKPAPHPTPPPKDPAPVDPPAPPEIRTYVFDGTPNADLSMETRLEAVRRFMRMRDYGVTFERSEKGKIVKVHVDGKFLTPKEFLDLARRHVRGMRKPPADGYLLDILGLTVERKQHRRRPAEVSDAG
jgi:hypothetical protein